MNDDEYCNRRDLKALGIKVRMLRKNRINVTDCSLCANCQPNAGYSLPDCTVLGFKIDMDTIPDLCKDWTSREDAKKERESEELVEDAQLAIDKLTPQERKKIDFRGHWS